MLTSYQDQELCGRPGWDRGVEAGEDDTLPQEQQAGGGGQRGCERLLGHHPTLGTWLGQCPSVLGSWHSFFHVQQILKSSWRL